MSRRRTAPTVLQIPSFWLRYMQSFDFLLARKYQFPRQFQRKCVEVFSFCNDEKDFARKILEKKKNLWLFRSNQQHFCGDFFVIDMSSPRPEKRVVYVLDLKMGAKLKLGGGGAGIQFKNVSSAFNELIEITGEIEQKTPLIRVTGDGKEILQYLGVTFV